MDRSAVVAGDTAGRDSILSFYENLAAISGNRIAVAYNNYHPNDFRTNALHSSLSIAIFDSSLNLVSAPKRLKQTYYPGTERFGGCSLQSLTAGTDRFIIGYRSGDTSGRRGAKSELPRFLIVDLNGNLIRDSIAGTTPTLPLGKVLNRELAEIVPYPGDRFLITGFDLQNDDNRSRAGYVIANRNMEPLDSGNFSYSERYTTNYQGGYFPQFHNTVALPGGDMIIAREFSPDTPPAGQLDGFWLGMFRLSAADSFKVIKKRVFTDQDFLRDHNSNPCLLSLGYNPRDYRIYYATTDNRDFGYVGGCGGLSNFIQVYCLDTNLNLLWHKFIQPAEDRCSFVTRTTTTGQRSGFTIMGFYRDELDPRDTGRAGYFLYHLDSTGKLDAPSAAHASIRDRIEVFPNPATDLVTISDLRAELIFVTVYNAAGQRIQSIISKGEKTLTISVGTFPPGSYIIETRTRDGLHHTQRLMKH